MREHVGETDERGVAVRVLGVMALDRGGDRVGQAPAAGERAADERVVDDELAAFAGHALLGRPRVAVDVAGVAGVRVGQDELADVVQQRGDHEPVAVLVAGLAGQPVGGALRGDRVQAQLLGRTIAIGRAVEEVERRRVLGELRDYRGRQHLDGADDGVRPARVAVGRAHDADRQRDVGLDRSDDRRLRRALGGEERQQPIARLRQGGERVERLERGGEAVTGQDLPPAPPDHTGGRVIRRRGGMKSMASLARLGHVRDATRARVALASVAFRVRDRRCHGSSPPSPFALAR